MRNVVTICLILISSLLINSCEERKTEETDRMDWWREARFGLFIHWGLYSIPAGEWNGSTNHAEWIRYTAQIPLDQYNELVSKFNPEKFDASEWVSIAKQAGMKYIVITSKHHDGFCLWDSKETDFDVMSTPFKRDILKELSDACSREGIVLCFYHSIMDWHHPDYLPRRKWEVDREVKDADMGRYVAYMKNQLNELLTNYGEIGVLWFDGEWEETWTHEDGKGLYNYLRNSYPGLIINNRVDKGRTDMAGMTKDGSFVGDFGTPEQEVPSTGLPGVDWESCITMNDNWGYNKSDNNWKSSEELIRTLIDITSKGGNFLLNVGPTSEGLFPDSSIKRLNDIGEWMKINSEAIYGTHAGPFHELPWGRCTRKVKGKNSLLYFFVFDWPGNDQLIIPSMENKIVRAFALTENGKMEVPFEVTDNSVISVKLDQVQQSKYATVFALEIKGEPVVTNNQGDN